MLVGSLQLSKKSTEWRRTLILRSLRVTWDKSGTVRRCLRGCFPESLCFSRLHFFVRPNFLFFRAFLLICWVKEFLEGMATKKRAERSRQTCSSCVQNHLRLFILYSVMQESTACLDHNDVSHIMTSSAGLRGSVRLSSSELTPYHGAHPLRQRQ